jgi:hypothetical protein
MANYYVDFNAGSNGTGSSASPWNVFTSTQSASVNAGDFVWFRRILVTYDTKFVAWKAGTAGNKITYLGWPIAGDEYFDSREESLEAVWDKDPQQYVYQIRRTFIAYTPAAALANYTNVHRFYILEDQQSNTSMRISTSTKDASFVTLKNCYLFQTYNANCTLADWYGGTLYCENSFSIELIKCTIDGSGSGSISKSTTIKISNSSVSFTDCTLQYGWPTGGAPIIAQINDYMSSYVKNSNVSFTNCSFNFRQTSANISSVYSTTDFYAMQHFINTITTFNGCVVKVNCATSNSITNLLPINIPIAIFRIDGGSINVQNTTTESFHNKYTMFELMNNTAATFNTVSWDLAANVISNIFIYIRTAIASLSLNTITGTILNNGSGTYETENFLFCYYSHIASYTNVTRVNVAAQGYVLDATRLNNATVYQSINFNENTTGLTKQNTVYTCVNNYINATNADIGGFKFMQKSYTVGDFIQGSSMTVVNVKISKSAFSKVPIQIQNINNQCIFASIHSCSGAGTDILQANGNTVYSLFLLAVRNRGFSGMGTLSELPWINARSILNDFNNGTAQYISYDINYETSVVSRVGGAGYSVKIIKKLDDANTVVYPNLGEETTWVFFPTSGTYTITAFFIYTALSGSLVNADIKLGIDIMNSYSYEDVTNQTRRWKSHGSNWRPKPS